MLGVGAIWEVLKEFADEPPNREFWRSQARLNTQVARAVFRELCLRYHASALERPEEMLKEYEGERSPLLRSSVLETVILSLCARNDLRLKSEKWVRHYEEMRQLFDDLVDIDDDLNHGRVTYPILLALATERHAAEVRAYIFESWQGAGGGRCRAAHSKALLRDLLTASGALERTAERILDLGHTVRSGIVSEEFPGNPEGLLCLVEVKKAALHRLRANNWTPRRPNYSLYTLSRGD